MKSFRIIVILVPLILLGLGMFIYSNLLLKKENKKTILFLCVHNTFRSQIAEAYFNKFASEAKLNWQAKSAGFLEADKINEKAIILMREEGIDISDKKPKLITEKMITEAAKIIVLCQECGEQGLCLNLPKNEDIEYWRLENPAEMEIEKARGIRNLIKEKVEALIKTLKEI